LAITKSKQEYTFSQEIKEEIATALLDVSKQEVCAFLSGFFKQNGSLTFNNGQMGLDVQTANAVVARKVYQVIKRYYASIKVEIVVRRMVKLKKQNIYVLRIFDQTKAFFKQIYFFDEQGFSFGVPTPYRSGNLLHYYMQGLFLGSGSINNLQQSNYHLEIACSHEVFTFDVMQCMKPYEIEFKQIKRRNLYVLYLKDSTMIGDFLAFMKANNARFAFEDVRISRDMMNSMNRLINCEVANEQKTLKASEKQIANVILLKKNLGKEYFNEREQKIVALRQLHPEVSLTELSELLYQEYNLQISKSGLNHVFRKFAEKAKQITTAK